MQSVSQNNSTSTDWGTDMEVRRSAKIATVAELMECTVSDIYKLVRNGELEAHGKGLHGIRVFLDSVARYQQRETKIPRDKKLVPKIKIVSRQKV